MSETALDSLRSCASYLKEKAIRLYVLALKMALAADRA